MKKIVFTGGGSAGHIMPNIALIEELNGYDIYYLGTNGMEKNILSKYKNVKFVEIPAVKFKRTFDLKNLLIPYKLIKSTNYCKKKLQEINPDIIFSKGGYVSIPVCFAGSKLDIPVLTHESDLTVGLANKIIAKKSRYLCCSFKETADKFGKNAYFTGSPIRASIRKGNKDIVFNRHSITPQKPIILIVGGSLGATAINETIWQNIQSLTKHYIIIHIVGNGKLNNELQNTKDYYQLEFAKDIENYFSASDLVISRAGSNTIFELLALAKPMILIPLSKNASRGDQILNAKNFKNNGFANVILQEDLNYKTLEQTINQTLKNSNSHISKMKSSNKNIGNKKIIELIKECTK